MTGEIVNLRRVRKQRARSDAEAAAAVNRSAFGRSKGEKAQIESARRLVVKHLDGHRLTDDRERMDEDG